MQSCVFAAHFVETMNCALLKADEKDRAKGKEKGAQIWKWVVSHLGRAQDFLVGRDKPTVKTGNGKEENLDTYNMDAVEIF